MSVAFAKEESAEAASETILPARPISDRINLVTEAGLKMLHDELARARGALEAASVLDDVNERRRQSAVPVRDVTYYAERVRTAQLMPVPTSNDVIAFGHTVTFARDDGRTQTFRIVGVDEADAGKGLISFRSPLAAAILGAQTGEIVEATEPLGEIEILKIT